MQGSRKDLLVAVGLIVAGVIAFFGVLAAIGVDPDERPLGLFEWVLGGLLIGPGFGYLLKWRRKRDRIKRYPTSDPLA